MKSGIYVGTAAWSVPKQYKNLFPPNGSHLEKYAQVLTGVEVNSSFYKDHQAKTYERWAKVTPENFKFAVKLSKEITREKRLECSVEEIAEKIQAINCLGDKFNVLLVQLPPSLEFDREIAKEFFSNLREVTDVSVALEPRHPSWGTPAGLKIFKEFRLSKVVADPDPCEIPNWRDFLSEDLVYHRLHGSPRIYRSLYSEEAIEGIADLMRAEKAKHKNVWCAFDNTAYGFATYNALQMIKMLNPKYKVRLPTAAFQEYSYSM